MLWFWIVLGLVGLRVLWTVVLLGILTWDVKRGTYMGSAGIGIALLAIVPEAFLFGVSVDLFYPVLKFFDWLFNIKED